MLAMLRPEAWYAANLPLCRSQLFHFTAIDRFDECVSRGKMAIESSGSYAGLFGDIVEAGVRAKTGKRLLRHLQNSLAVPLRVGTRLSGWTGCGRLLAMRKNTCNRRQSPIIY